MKYFSFLLISILATKSAVGQDNRKYIVKEGTRPRDTFTYTDIYLYPSFNFGKVYFTNNTSGSGRMNYNRFTSDIDFINEKDTLALADQELIKTIIIGDDIFYNQQDIGYIQMVRENSYLTLAKKEIIYASDRRKQTNPASNTTYNNLITPGAGVSSGTPSQAIISGTQSQGQGSASLFSFNMTERIDVIYEKRTDYYFGNAKHFFVKANKKNLLKLFKEKKTAIDLYLKANVIDYNNAESVQNLFKAIANM